MDYTTYLEQAQICIRIPYPKHIVDAVEHENDAAKAALSEMPRYATKLIEVCEHPLASEFADAINMMDVRLSLARKAAKLGFERPTGMFPVNISHSRSGVVFYIFVYSRRSPLLATPHPAERHE